MSDDLYFLGHLGSTHIVGRDHQPWLRLKPVPLMSLWGLQKRLLMLLFQFTAEQRGEFLTLLAFCWSTTVQITDDFLGSRGSVELQCGFTRGLMKTWRPSRLESILWGSWLRHIEASLQMSTLVMVWGECWGKDFLPGKQSQT